uniref:BTB domain-containing protein n=1 Tax=Ascaris lumbricoides TaxID=6252 RepID=A0A0M3IFK1_ASCLU
MAQSVVELNEVVESNDQGNALPILLEKPHGFDELSNPLCKFINFEYDFRIHRDSIQAAKHNGCLLQSAIPMIVYHAHMWWNYGYKLTLHGDKPNADLGPRATTNESLPKGALKINTLSNQLSPKASNIYLRIGYRKDDKFISVVEGDSSVNDATDYYVHKAPLAYTSITLRSIFDKKVSLPTDQILIESSEDRIIFPFLSINDMKFLLTYLYTERITLPEYNRFARVGRVISFLFDRDRLLNIFTQWQRLIIESIFKANGNQEKVVYAMRSLIAIYSAPYGALPIAKRVAISTLADQVNKFNSACSS